MGNITATNKKYLKQARAKRRSQECMLKQYIQEHTKTDNDDVISLDLMDLERKQIICEDIPIIFHCIPKKEKLIHLRINLQNNNIREEGIKYLVSNLNKCVQLESFHIQLDNNCIGDQGVLYLVQGLNQCKQLKSVSIYLQNNSITKDGIEFLEGLMENQNILDFTLSLSKNTLGKSIEKVINQIASCFPNIKELQLFLQNCDITNTGAQLCANKLKNLKQLKSLSLFLNNNSITDNGILLIVNNICTYSSLENLTLNICDSKIQEAKSYFSPINVFSDKCVLKVLQNISSHLKLNQLNLTMKNYNHRDYLDFLKNGFEALEREETQNKSEMDQMINSLYQNQQKFLIEI